MKYISGIAGAILLIYLLSMDRVSIFGRVCYIIGSAKINPGSGGLLGQMEQPVCLNPGIYYTGMVVAGALILLSVFLVARDVFGNNQTVPAHSHSASYSSSYRPVERRQEPAKPAPAAKTYDTGKWAALKEFDADVAAAAAQLDRFGDHAKDRLATAFLAVNDKSLLPSMVAKIIADETEARAAREMAAAAKKSALGDRAAKLVAEREERARATLAEIKSNGMMLGGKRVVDAIMRDDDLPHLQGWLEIVYEDGTKELRAGDSWQRL